MANFHRNNVENVVLGHHRSKSTSIAGGHFRMWHSLSTTSFCRLVFNAVSCGTNSRYVERSDTYSKRHHHQPKQQHRHKMKPNNEDLLNLAEVKADTETKKKEDKLEELKSLVKELLKEDEIEKEKESMTRRREATSKVRLLTKEDLEVCSLMFNV
ncbi:hypothetical protein LR48_Vigan02g033600 [Vigna angularis]|nr:hypothetical protein LR48_Vigan02g033600 [Vigna angularis]